MQYLIHTLLCGDHPTIKELIDYDQFCGIAPAPAEADSLLLLPVLIVTICSDFKNMLWV